MPKLSDTILVILSNAAKRDERLVLPLSKSLKGGVKAATPVLKDLLKKKLIVEQTAAASMPVWREEGGLPIAEDRRSYRRRPPACAALDKGSHDASLAAP